MKEIKNEDTTDNKLNVPNSVKGAGKGIDRQKAVILRLSKIDLTRKTKQ